jgi:asparagine synthase (glutamine-hydrolysing)
MCGILFAYNYANQINKEDFSKALDKLLHRGPDSKQVIEDGKFLFGFTRLAIQDLSINANQPMVDLFGNILIFNGEIYNFKEIRHKLNIEFDEIVFNTSSDTEVLLYALAYWGVEKTLTELIGMFSFVYKNNKDSKLYAARDNFGMKPLFFSSNENELIIASEIKSILPLIRIKELDKSNSLNPIFFTGLSPYGKTMFRGIERLMPGQILSFDITTKELRIKKYFDLLDLVDRVTYENISKMNENEYVEMVRKEIEKSVEMHSISDAKSGVLFSAGLDSSIIAAILSKINSGKVDLFKYESDNLKDSNLADEFVNKFNGNLQTVKKIDNEIIYDLPRLIYHYETINKSDGSPLGLCCKLARERNYKVLLTGDAADEIFGGYGSFEQYITKKNIKNLKFFPILKIILNKIIPGFSDLMGAELDYMVSPFSTDLLESFLDINLYGGRRKSDFLNAKNAYRFIENPVERDINAFLLDEVNTRLERFLIRNDRYGMMESIEMRVPFLTLPIVKIAVNTPYYLKCKFSPSIIGKKIYSQKRILKKIAEKLNIPNKIIYRPKIGTPIGESNYYLQEIIFKNWDLENAANFLDVSQINLKNTIILSGSKIEKDRQIWNLLSLEILIRLFINSENYIDIENEFREIIKNYAK